MEKEVYVLIEDGRPVAVAPLPRREEDAREWQRAKPNRSLVKVEELT